MKIIVRKEGGLWHGYLEGHPEVDERGLTEEVAKRKTEQVARRLAMADNEYHIVYELPEGGFDRPRIYMATLDELRERGWRPNYSHHTISDETVVDYESGTRLSEPFDSWDAHGNDAWISTADYPATKRIGPRHLKERKM
jgi:hypothetical protein